MHTVVPRPPLTRTRLTRTPRYKLKLNPIPLALDTVFYSNLLRLSLNSNSSLIQTNFVFPWSNLSRY